MDTAMGLEFDFRINCQRMPTESWVVIYISQNICTDMMLIPNYMFGIIFDLCKELLLKKAYPTQVTTHCSLFLPNSYTNFLSVSLSIHLSELHLPPS